MEKSNNQKKGDKRLKTVMDERSSKQLKARLSLNAFFYLTKTASGYSLEIVRFTLSNFL